MTNSSASIIGMRELRSALATNLRRANNGERIIITVDGRPVAQVGPIAPSAGPTLPDLIAAGMVEPPRRPDRPGPPVVNHLATGQSTQRILEELRGR